MTTVSPMVKVTCFAPTFISTASSLSAQMRLMSCRAAPGMMKLSPSRPLPSSFSRLSARR